MSKNLWITIILACLALETMAAQAATPTYDAIYVFGDSYCDVGNLFTATGNTYPPSPYYNGRFSNGPLWIEHVAGYLGVPMHASLLGGTNYAFGGAWVTAPQPLGGGATIPSVPEQVGLFLSQHGGKADPNALYIIEGGGNDIVGTTSGSPDALGYQIAVGIAESELTLRRAGARHFVIPDLFNVGLLPVAAANATFAAAASSAANNWLNTLLGVEQLLEGVRIIRLDVFSLMNAVQTDSTHFRVCRCEGYLPVSFVFSVRGSRPHLLLGYLSSDCFRAFILCGNARKCSGKSTPVDDCLLRSGKEGQNDGKFPRIICESGGVSFIRQCARVDQ